MKSCSESGRGDRLGWAWRKLLIECPGTWLKAGTKTVRQHWSALKLGRVPGGERAQFLKVVLTDASYPSCPEYVQQPEQNPSAP